MLISVAALLLATHLSLPDQVGARHPIGRSNVNRPLLPFPKIREIREGGHGPVKDVNGVEIAPYNTTYYFDQLIDHNDSSKGTFRVRYWTTWEYYKPGGPIVIMTPGEENAECCIGYLANTTMLGQIAQQENGATIVMEHRFYGESNPYPDLSVKSFEVHTIAQAIEDFDYFARNVKLPFPGGDEVGPDKAPWVLVGGSYAGALTSWTKVTKPHTFYAGYSSSGVVQAIANFWPYYTPILQHMPANCSADIQAVIALIDEVFLGQKPIATSLLKDLFGLGGLSHLDDVAEALLRNVWAWQDLQPDSGPNATFFEFCDALEVKDGVSAPASGWGLAHALPAWGNYFKTVTLPDICGDTDVETCLGTYDPDDAYWTNTTIDNAGRSYYWTLCNELGFFESAPPSGPTLVSSLVQSFYFARQCTLMFEEAFPQPPIPDTNATNSKYHGWNVTEPRLFFANGHQDPWREATISAESQGFVGTPQQPIEVSNGFHCTDMTMDQSIDPTVAAVQDKALASMKVWLAAWPDYKQELEVGRRITLQTHVGL